MEWVREDTVVSVDIVRDVEKDGAGMAVELVRVVEGAVELEREGIAGMIVVNLVVDGDGAGRDVVVGGVGIVVEGESDVEVEVVSNCCYLVSTILKWVVSRYYAGDFVLLLIARADSFSSRLHKSWKFLAWCLGSASASRFRRFFILPTSARSSLQFSPLFA